jgi:REase_MTES_1575
MTTFTERQPSSAPQSTDVCARCQQPISSNAQWCFDRAHCSLCALELVVQGYRMHGSRIQGRFYDAAGTARPGVRTDSWLLEEYPVVLSGRNFRADFVVRATLPYCKIAVELDSFAHHSSPTALLRDRQRQRLFQRDGWLVIRFAGSEVWRNPAGCVEELLQIVAQEVYSRGLAQAA